MLTPSDAEVVRAADERLEKNPGDRDATLVQLAFREYCKGQFDFAMTFSEFLEPRPQTIEQAIREQDTRDAFLRIRRRLERAE